MDTGRAGYDFYAPVSIYFLQGIEYEGPVEVWTPRPHEGGVDDGGGAWKVVEFARGARQPGDRKSAVRMRFDTRTAKMRVALVVWMTGLHTGLDWLLRKPKGLLAIEYQAIVAWNARACRKGTREWIDVVVAPWRVVSDTEARQEAYAGGSATITVTVLTTWPSQENPHHALYIRWNATDAVDRTRDIADRTRWGGTTADFCGGTILDLCASLFPNRAVYEDVAGEGGTRLRLPIKGVSDYGRLPPYTPRYLLPP